MESAVLGGGCFWCLEAIYKRLDGVGKIEPGYAGGQVENPTYKAVCAGTTGHAEVIRLEFDPEKISFEDILEWFWKGHDPTTLNRQGNDVGTQYRSAVYYQDESQHKVVLHSVKALEATGTLPGPVVTEIAPLDVFYPAENYHHDYFDSNEAVPYCTYVIRPKLAKLNLL